MSSRSYVLFFVLSCTALATTAGMLSACTTETTVVNGSDASSDAAREVSGPKDSGGTDEDAGQTTDECIAACEQKYAAGLTKDKAIDTCWGAKCNDPCIQGTGTFDAGGGGQDAGDDGGDASADAGDGGDGGATTLACQNDVSTGDDACNACTKTFCCDAWDACFSDKDCSDLNDCRSNCQ